MSAWNEGDVLHVENRLDEAVSALRGIEEFLARIDARMEAAEKRAVEAAERVAKRVAEKVLGGTPA